MTADARRAQLIMELFCLHFKNNYVTNQIAHIDNYNTGIYYVRCSECTKTCWTTVPAQFYYVYVTNVVSRKDNVLSTTTKPPPKLVSIYIDQNYLYVFVLSL